MSLDRDERGAVAIVAAGAVALMVAMAAFAVDLGMQRVVRADMQALADVVALDAARLLDGRSADKILAGDERHDSLSVVVARSATANADTLGTTPSVSATLVMLGTDPNGAVAVVKNGAGQPAAVTGNVVPDAVLVKATGSVDFAFSTGKGDATRQAIANADTYACFRLGSFAAALSSGGTPVAGVFEAVIKDALGLNLQAVGYSGLLQSSVDIGDLAARLNAATPQELADLGSVKVADLLAASAYVLGQEGQSSAQAEVLKMSTGVTQTLRVKVSDILTTGSGSVLEGRVNIIDLLGSVALGVAAVVSNGNNFLDTGVAWAAPHVSAGNIELRAIESPQQACGTVGDAVARTAQVAMEASLAFTLPNKLGLGSLGSLDVGTPTNPSSKDGTLSLNASMAGATGRLVEATCSASEGDVEGIGVMIDTRPLTTSVTLPFRLKGVLSSNSGSIPLVQGTLVDDLLQGIFGLLPTVLNAELTVDLVVRNTVTATTAGVTAVSPTQYLVPPRDYTDVEPAVNGQPVALPTPVITVDAAASTLSLKVQTLLNGTTTTTVALSALDVTALTNAVAGSVINTSTASVVANVNSALTPVSKLVGISTTGADLLGVSAPECGIPALVG